MIEISIGVCVYNEEKNIVRFLDSLKKQRLREVKISEILIIASGTTDNSLPIAKTYAKKDRRIAIIEQPRREGKASAVNLFIKRARKHVLVLMGGDLILSNDVVEKLGRVFKEKNIGMSGARPMPLNQKNEGFLAFAGQILWELHHRISLVHPKMGEVIAFRKIFKRIPIYSSVDEANIEPLIRGQGYVLKYVPSAIVYNKAPTTLSDFIKQRRRIYSGHLVAKHEQGYQVATMGIFRILLVLLLYIQDNFRFKTIVYITFVIMLEAYSRFLGWWDYAIAKKRHTVWEPIRSTKKL